nr:PD40 domain-containing protein [Gemmatimonadota bacterium]
MRITRLSALVIGMVLLLPGTLPGQELTLQSMNENVSIRDAAFSPDGGQILLVSNRSGRNKLWIMDRNGGNPRLLVRDDGGESSPAWSPDGGSVAFLRADGGQPDTWVVDVATGTPRRVTNDPEG